MYLIILEGTTLAFFKKIILVCFLLHSVFGETSSRKKSSCCSFQAPYNTMTCMSENLHRLTVCGLFHAWTAQSFLMLC